MAVFVSEGRITSVEQVLPQFSLTPTSVGLYGTTVRDYVTIYRSQNAVRVVVDFLARNIADIGIHAYRREPNNSRVRIRAEDHPLAAFLEQPNPVLTQYELLWWTVVDKAVFDQAFWIKMQVGPERMVQPVPPIFIYPRGGNFLRPTSFRLQGNQGYEDFDLEQVVHFRGYDPADPRQGISPIESLRRLLAEDESMGIYRENFWRNGAQASGFLHRPADAPEWNAREKSRFKADWQARFGPGGNEAGGTPILEDGMSFTTASFDAQQSQYIETRKLTREEASSAYGVAPTLVGILDHATFSNIDAQHIQAYQDTLGPWLTAIEQRLMKDLVPNFPDTKGLYVEFNLDKKLKGSFEEQARSLQSAAGGPWLTRNEVRARMNMPSLGPAGDEIVVPANVYLGGGPQASPNDSAPKGLSAEQQQQVRRFLERQTDVTGKRFMAAHRKGDLSMAEVMDLLNIDRWNRELVRALES